MQVYHVYAMHDMDEAAHRRHCDAVRSWPGGASRRGWQQIPVRSHMLKRNAQGLGDTRDLLYLKDVVGVALRRCRRDEDIVVLSNADTCMVPGIADDIRTMVQAAGACHAHRYDVDVHLGPLDRTEMHLGRWYPGTDLFAFSQGWWRRHAWQYPDLLLGAEFVDSVLRQVIKLNTPMDCELRGVIYHVRHVSAWTLDRRSASSLYNTALARAWFAARGTDDLDPFPIAEAERIRAQRARRR